MNELTIVNLPDGLYDRIQDFASDRKLTLEETVLYLLQQAFEDRENPIKRGLQNKPMSEILQSIRSRPRANPMSFGLLDSTTLIREDRDR